MPHTVSFSWLLRSQTLIENILLSPSQTNIIYIYILNVFPYKQHSHSHKEFFFQQVETK